MEKAIVTLDKGSICSAWNYSGQRLAAGSVDGSLAIYDSSDPFSSNFTCTSRFKVFCNPFQFLVSDVKLLKRFQTIRIRLSICSLDVLGAMFFSLSTEMFFPWCFGHSSFFELRLPADKSFSGVIFALSLLKISIPYSQY